MNTKNTVLMFAVEADKAMPQRFRGVAYSGGLIPSYGFYGDAAIDLSTMQLPKGNLFALVDHEHDKRAGQFSARIDDNQIIVEGSLFSSTEAGREVAALMAEGAPWQMSVGIQAKADEVNGDADVNGQTLKINTLFTQASLREVSFVPIGADPNTSVAAFSRNLAAANSINAEVPQIEDDNMSAELQAQIDELSAQLAAEKTARQEAEAALAEIKAGARKDAIDELAADLGREFGAAEIDIFTAMDDAAFGVISSTLKAFKPTAPEHLFSEQATQGVTPDPKADALLKARAKILNQVGGKAA